MNQHLWAAPKGGHSRVSEFNKEREMSLRKRKYFHFCIAGFISSGVPKEDSCHFPREADSPALPPGWFPRSLLAASCFLLRTPTGIWGNWVGRTDAKCRARTYGAHHHPADAVSSALSCFYSFSCTRCAGQMCLLSYFDGGFVRMSLDW